MEYLIHSTAFSCKKQGILKNLPYFKPNFARLFFEISKYQDIKKDALQNSLLQCALYTKKNSFLFLKNAPREQPSHRVARLFAGTGEATLSLADNTIRGPPPIQRQPLSFIFLSGSFPTGGEACANTGQSAPPVPNRTPQILRCPKPATLPGQ